MSGIGSDIELRGLTGANPLGFFAALGVLWTVERFRPEARIRWHAAANPTPVLSSELVDVEALVDLVMDDHSHWSDAPALTYGGLDDIKLSQDEVRGYLQACVDDVRSGPVAMALVTQGVVDNKGASKPTDFHFTAGQQKFLLAAREIHQGLKHGDVREAIVGPWSYDSAMKSLMWDTTDDRIYALSATDPAKDKKQSQPGAEWLAFLGLSAFPLMTGDERTLTPGCGGSWKSGSFRWPLWDVPIGFDAARSLIATRRDRNLGDRLHGLGCFALLESQIRRSAQGGYGTFGPPVTIWQRHPAEGSRLADPFST